MAAINAYLCFFPEKGGGVEALQSHCGAQDPPETKKKQ
jgi:hypothetical protein